ncbi:MAG: VanZ family protein [Clostridia bacterium]|nr:VanZ family protein [Clostridia bacterium]
MKKKTLIRIIFAVYLVAFIAFIFSNSLPSIEESAQTSGKALSIINKILDFFGIPTMAGDLIIRKTAHFIEFFILGASLFINALLYTELDKNTAFYCIFASCLVAMTDETIQYFSERGSMLLDVWLDLSGATTAILIFFLIYRKKQLSK